MDTKKTRVYTCNVLDGTVASDYGEMKELLHENEEIRHVLVDESSKMKECLLK